MTRNARIALLLAALAVAVAAAVVIGTGDSGDEDDVTATAPTAGPATATTTAPPEPPPIPVVRVRDGQPAGGVKTLEFDSGERARFAVESNTRQEIHFHGYDIARTVPAGGRTVFSFRADAQGVYEVESHDTGERIATVKVVP